MRVTATVTFAFPFRLPVQGTLLSVTRTDAVPRSVIASATIEALVTDAELHGCVVTLVYDSAEITVARTPVEGRFCGYFAARGYLCPQLDALRLMVEPALANCAAATMRVEGLARPKTADAWVADARWTDPVVMPCERTSISFSNDAIRNDHRSPVTQELWNESASGGDAPAWKWELLEAFEAHAFDYRVAIVRAASAMELGISPLLPSGKSFSPAVLRGDVPPLASLRDADPKLFELGRNLWHTRSGIVHFGKADLFERRPKDGPPVRRLEHGDVQRFLNAVPRIVGFYRP